MSLTPMAVKDRRGEEGYMQSHSREATDVQYEATVMPRRRGVTASWY